MSTEKSLWTASASAPPVDAPPLDRSVDVDVAIVGGGFTGLSTALHLAEAGRTVCLLEAREIGYGASGRNGGQANPGLKHGEAELVSRFGEAGRAFFRLGEEAVDFLAALINRKGLRCGFIRPGLIRLAHSAPALKGLHAACDALNGRGIAARMLSRADVETTVGTQRYLGGLFDPRGGNLQPLELVRELARVAGEAGARIHSRTLVSGLSAAGDRWRVACPGGTVTASDVVIATNAYTDTLLPNLARTLLPVNSFQVATEPVGADLDRQVLPGRHAVYDSRRLVLYFRKSPDGRIVLGGRASFSPIATEQGDIGDYRVLEGVLLGIFPQLRDTPITHRWSGLVCITRDFLPHYHAPARGLHILLGYNGRGVALSTRAGAWLARKLAGLPDSGGIPATSIQAIPFHAARAPMLHAAMLWNRVADAVGR